MATKYTAARRPPHAPLYQFLFRPKGKRQGKGHKSVLIYGPQGTGKTLHAEELCRHFDLPYLLDEWFPGQPWPMTDHLVLSHCPPPTDMRRAIPIHTALAMLKSNAPGYPF